MTLAAHPLWRLFSALCAVADELEACDVPEALTAQLDRVIDHLAGLMLQQPIARDPEGLCPYCGGPLDDDMEESCYT